MIAIVDYGMGNLRSVQKALQHVGGEAEIVQTPSQLSAGRKIVLPGVGAFRDAVARLHEQRLVEPLVQAARDGVPFLGICLGLQLLFDVSYEVGEHVGLGVFPGKVVRFRFDSQTTGQDLRVPHMGWNQIRWDKPCPMLNGVQAGSFVYFAHSYYVVPINADITCTSTEYGYNFVSSIWRGNVFATQFHPEKSQSVGLRILENFVNL